MVADKFTDLQKAVGPEITKTDLVPAFQVRFLSNFEYDSITNEKYPSVFPSFLDDSLKLCSVSIWKIIKNDQKKNGK